MRPGLIVDASSPEYVVLCNMSSMDAACWLAEGGELQMTLQKSERVRWRLDLLSKVSAQAAGVCITRRRLA